MRELCHHHFHSLAALLPHSDINNWSTPPVPSQISTQHNIHNQGDRSAAPPPQTSRPGIYLRIAQLNDRYPKRISSNQRGRDELWRTRTLLRQDRDRVPHHGDLARMAQGAAEAADEDGDQGGIRREKERQRVLRKKVVHHGAVEEGGARGDEATVRVRLRLQIWPLGSRRSLLRWLRQQARVSRRWRRR